MSDRSSSSPSPGAVRRSLRALADGAAPPSDRLDCGDAAAAVGEAEDAVSCARSSVAYLSAGRLPELERAIQAATRLGDARLARRGRAVREALVGLRAALTAPRSASEGK